MKKQPPRWFLAIGGIGFLFLLVFEIVSFPHFSVNSGPDPWNSLGNAIGFDGSALACWAASVLTPYRGGWRYVLFCALGWSWTALVIVLNILAWR